MSVLLEIFHFSNFAFMWGRKGCQHKRFYFHCGEFTDKTSQFPNLNSLFVLRYSVLPQKLVVISQKDAMAVGGEGEGLCHSPISLGSDAVE